MRTCGLSHQIKGPTTVKLAKSGFNCKIVKFTITGPLIWCDNPQVRMSKILYINNNNFHHLGRSQMCAGGCYVFRASQPHSGTLWHTIRFLATNKISTFNEDPTNILRAFVSSNCWRRLRGVVTWSIIILGQHWIFSADLVFLRSWVSTSKLLGCFSSSVLEVLSSLGSTPPLCWQGSSINTS